jgi:hypothetical protein
VRGRFFFQVGRELARDLEPGRLDRGAVELGGEPLRPQGAALGGREGALLERGERRDVGGVERAIFVGLAGLDEPSLDAEAQVGEQRVHLDKRRGGVP